MMGGDGEVHEYVIYSANIQIIRKWGFEIKL